MVSNLYQMPSLAIFITALHKLCTDICIEIVRMRLELERVGENEV